jgi:hypothetical protein
MYDTTCPPVGSAVPLRINLLSSRREEGPHMALNVLPAISLFLELIASLRRCLFVTFYTARRNRKLPFLRVDYGGTSIARHSSYIDSFLRPP